MLISPVLGAGLLSVCNVIGFRVGIADEVQGSVCHPLTGPPKE